MHRRSQAAADRQLDSGLRRLASGLVLQTAQHGWRGAGSALLGTLAGAGVFLIFYLLGGMGGGDVKLMAGFGALLGVKRLFRGCFVDGWMRRRDGAWL